MTLNSSFNSLSPAHAELSKQQVVDYLDQRIELLHSCKHRQLVLCYLSLSESLDIINRLFDSPCLKHGVVMTDDSFLGSMNHSDLQNYHAMTMIGTKDYRTLLGQEFDLVMLDVAQGLRANAVAAAAGTISGGGLLVIVLPNQIPWPTAKCEEQKRLLGDYLKGDSPFIHHLESAWNEEPSTIIIKENTELQSFSMIMREHQDAKQIPKSQQQNTKPIAYSSDSKWSFANEEQQLAVESIQRVFLGHGRRPLVLTAERGRGKSTALGIALALLVTQAAMSENIREYWVCAPNRNAVERLFYWFQKLVPNELKDAIKFYLPTDIIEKLRLADVSEANIGVVVDEAAAIPAAQLEQILTESPRTVFSTTTHGYEGTGRGFSIRFQSTLDRITPKWRKALLKQPVRWSENDPLEKLIRRAFFLDVESETLTSADSNQLHIDGGVFVKDRVIHDAIDFHWQGPTPNSIINNEPSWWRQAFALLVESHYQTSPDDLRQYWEHPKRSLIVAELNGLVVGVLWLVEEGELSNELVDDISYGKRRVRGHMVAQSLAFHCGVPELAKRKSWRVQRVAVHHQYRRCGVGTLLLKQLTKIGLQNNVDFLSTSFAASSDLVPFWLNNQFFPVRFGLSLDKCSGCHSLAMVHVLDSNVQERLDFLQQKFFGATRLLLSNQLKDLEPSLVMVLWEYNHSDEECLLSIDELQECKQFSAGHRHFGDAIVGINSLHRWAIGNISKMSAENKEIMKQMISLVWQQNTLKEWQHQFKYAGIKDANKQLRHHINELLNFYEATI